ncbi:HD domain-containing protein [Candidatus Babeliales bacterium]|nr:HD domain-containing protein [Candidatus Babeliales bacterium]
MQIVKTNHRVSTNFSDFLLLSLKNKLSHAKDRKIFAFGETAINILMNDPIKYYKIATHNIAQEDFITTAFCTPFEFVKHRECNGVDTYLSSRYPLCASVLEHCECDGTAKSVLMQLRNKVCALQELIAIDLMTGEVYKDTRLDLKSNVSGNTDSFVPYKLPKLMTFGPAVTFKTNIYPHNALKYIRLAQEQQLEFPLLLEDKFLDSFNNIFVAQKTEDWQSHLNLIFHSEKCHQIIRWLGYKDRLDAMCGTPGMWKEAKRTKQRKTTSADVFAHTIRVMKFVYPDLQLKIAAMFHDVGKIYCHGNNFTGHEEKSAIIAGEVMSNWGYSDYIIEPVVSAIRNHMYIGGIQRNLKPPYSYEENQKIAKQIIKRCGSPYNAILAIQLAIADKLSTHNKTEYVLPLMAMLRICWGG